MYFILAMALMIGPAPTPDLIGTWRGPHIIHLLNGRGWGSHTERRHPPNDQTTLLLQLFRPPDYLYRGPIRCRYEHTREVLTLSDFPYEGQYKRAARPF